MSDQSPGVTNTRMKPGPFQQLLDEARRYGIDTTGYSNDRGSVERLRQRIEDQKSAGTRPQMVAGKRTIHMDNIPTFNSADATEEQFARCAAAYFMRLVDWYAGGGDTDKEPQSPDLLREDDARTMAFRTQIHLLAGQAHRIATTRARRAR